MSFKCFFQNLYYLFFLGIWFAWWNAVRKKIKNPRESREAKKVKPKSPSRVPTSPLMAGGDGCGERDGKRGGYKWGGVREQCAVWKGGHKWEGGQCGKEDTSGGGDNVERRTQVGGGGTMWKGGHKWGGSKSLPQHVLTRMKKTEKDNRDLRAQISFLRKKIKILESQKTPQILRKKFERTQQPRSQNTFGEYFRWGWVICSLLKIQFLGVLVCSVIVRIFIIRG